MPSTVEDFAARLPSAAHDFDFLFGDWRAFNRRLRERLSGSDIWEEFEASIAVRPLLGGLGNIDQYLSTAEGRYFEGITLRVFSLTDLQWSIRWADTRSGNLQPPVVGGFVDGIGTFVGEDAAAGRPVLSRSRWSESAPDSAHWEQAFSWDGGTTWETNWIMELARR